MTTDDILLAAWKRGAPRAALDNGFPRGFWPDVARVAVEMALQGTLEPVLDFRPTACDVGRPDRVTSATSGKVPRRKAFERSPEGERERLKQRIEALRKDLNAP